LPVIDVGLCPKDDQIQKKVDELSSTSNFTAKIVTPSRNDIEPPILPPETLNKEVGRRRRPKGSIREVLLNSLVDLKLLGSGKKNFQSNQ
jgi:hypothetical protein